MSEEEDHEARLKTRQWLAAQEAPAVGKDGFVCPHCGAYAHQTWGEAMTREGPGRRAVNGGQFTTCQRCHECAYWYEGKLVYPTRPRQGPAPHTDMPDDPKGDYIEAQTILDLSPRGACALLRLAVQKLMVELGEKGENINADIASLVSKGLPIQVQQALDSLRVIGNNALHPGEMDLKDDRETALALFGVLNFIVEQRIAQPRQLEELYGKLPQDARDQIAKRDAPKS